MAGAALIIDGYNLIFRLAPEALAAPGELHAYRGRLEEAVRGFGQREGRRPWVIYDGQRLPGKAAGAVEEPHLKVSFAEPPAEADDVICQVALLARDGGQAVTVVTSDAGLAARLRPAGVMVVPVEAFGAGLLPGEGAGADPSLPDVERFFLTLHEREEAVRRFVERQERAHETAAGSAGGEQASGSPGARSAAGAGTDAELRRRRGERRQQRRLAGRRGAGRRKRRR